MVTLLKSIVIVAAIMLLGTAAHAFFANHGMLVSGPSGPSPTAVSPSNGSVSDTATSGTVITPLSCTMSDGSNCSATFSVTDPNNLVSVNGTNLVVTTTLTAAKDGVYSNITLKAFKNGRVASQPYTLTVSATVTGGGGCTGVSSDPNAAQDGFTKQFICVDFTQPDPLPANTVDCSTQTLTSTGQVHVTGIFHFIGTGWNGCQYGTHEIDPKSGKWAYRLRYVCDISTTFCAFNNNDQSGIQFTVNGYFEQAYYQAIWRVEDTVPGGPLPAGNPSLVYGGDINFWTAKILSDSSNTELNGWELWTIDGRGSNCPTSQTLPQGDGGFISFWNPCSGIGPAAPDPTQYFKFAYRATGDGTTRGYTAWINGQQTAGSGRSSYATGEQSTNGNVYLWNAVSQCQFGGTHLPCQNVPINSVFQCGDGNTCVTLSTNISWQNGGPLTVWIWPGGGISGLQGSHTATGATGGSSFELTDLRWPGGSYSGGAKWNAITERNVWVQQIEVDTCPAWDPTIAGSGVPSNQQCNGTVLP